MASQLPSHGPREDEPLLGRPGDVSQKDDQSLIYNLWMGTAPFAQAGIWIMAAAVWSAVFEVPLNLFSAHPLLNSAGLVLVTQAILVVQPTHTPAQKAAGTTAHFLFQLFGTLALVAALIVIVYNKLAHDGPQFQSVHAILGLVTYILFILQALAGFTQYYLPNLYGGELEAKKLYKFHRLGGYVAFVLGLATVCAATATDFNRTTLHIHLWVMLATSVLVLVGIVPRIKLHKFGLKRS